MLVRNNGKWVTILCPKGHLITRMTPNQYEQSTIRFKKSVLCGCE